MADTWGSDDTVKAEWGSQDSTVNSAPAWGAEDKVVDTAGGLAQEAKSDINKNLGREESTFGHIVNRIGSNISNSVENFTNSFKTGEAPAQAPTQEAPRSPMGRESTPGEKTIEDFINSGTNVLAKGFISQLPNNITSTVSDYLESAYPGVLKSIGDVGGVGTVGGVVPLDAQGKPQGAPLSSDSSPEWFAKTPEERFKELHAVKNDYVAQFYKGVDVSQHPYLNIAGHAFGGTVDPAMLFAPELEGLSYLGKIHELGKFGAKFGMADVAIDNLANKGVPHTLDETIDAVSEMAMGGVLGYGTGAALHALVLDPAARLAGLTRAKMESGEKITPEDINSVKDTAALPPSVGGAKSEDIAAAMNEQLHLGKPLGERVAAEMNDMLALGKPPEKAVEPVQEKAPIPPYPPVSKGPTDLAMPPEKTPPVANQQAVPDKWMQDADKAYESLKNKELLPVSKEVVQPPIPDAMMRRAAGTYQGMQTKDQLNAYRYEEEADHRAYETLDENPITQQMAQSHETDLDLADTPPATPFKYEIPHIKEGAGKLHVGPGGSIRIYPIAEGKPLFRETNADGLSSVLGENTQWSYRGQMHVSDNKDLALGQQGNKGIHIEFRPDSLSGVENKSKPGLGVIEGGGTEFKVEASAPNAVSRIIFDSQNDVAKVRGLAKRRLASDFEKSIEPDGSVVYTSHAVLERQKAKESATNIVHARESKAMGEITDLVEKALKEGKIGQHEYDGLVDELSKGDIDSRGDYIEKVADFLHDKGYDTRKFDKISEDAFTREIQGYQRAQKQHEAGQVPRLTNMADPQRAAAQLYKDLDNFPYNSPIGKAVRERVDYGGDLNRDFLQVKQYSIDKDRFVNSYDFARSFNKIKEFRDSAFAELEKTDPMRWDGRDITDHDPQVQQATDMLDDNPDLSQQILQDANLPIDPEKPLSFQALEVIRDDSFQLGSGMAKQVGANIVDDVVLPPGPPGGGGASGGGDGIDSIGHDGIPDPMRSTVTDYDMPDSISLTFMQSRGRPWRTWSLNLGKTGAEMAERARQWYEDTQAMQGFWDAEYKNVFFKHDLDMGKDGIIVRQLCNTVLWAEYANKAQVPITKAHLDASKEISQLFKNKIMEFVEKGILTDKQGNELLDHNDKFGYFPRVYDMAYLRTKHGYTKWLTELGNAKYKNLVTAQNAIRSITGQRATEFSDSVVKNADGTYSLKPNIYRFMWQKTTSISDANLSSHMEKERKLPDELEPILDKFFVVQDFEQAMSKYGLDVNHRLSTATHWGVKNEKFIELYRKAYRKNIAIAEDFRENWHRNNGDPRSFRIQTFMNVPTWQKNAAAVLTTMQVFKMTLGAIKNSAQSFVGDATILAGKTSPTWFTPQSRAVVSPLQAVNAFMRGRLGGFVSEWSPYNIMANRVNKTMGQALKQMSLGEWGDMARMFGSGLEHTFANFFGAISPNHPIGAALKKIEDFGADQGIMGLPIEQAAKLIRDPGHWLKMWAFGTSENSQRTSSFWTSMYYMKSMLNNLQKYEKAQRTQGKDFSIKIKAIRREMQRLGIPKYMKVNEITLQQMTNASWMMARAQEDDVRTLGKAAQRWSNEVNYTTNPAERSRTSGTFWGKMLTSLGTFSYGQSGFVMDKILTPIGKKKNFIPLAMFLITANLAGYPLLDAWRMVRGDNREMTPMAHALAVTSSFASFGQYQDILASTTYGRYAPLVSLTGAPLATASSAAAAGGQIWNTAATKGELDLSPIGKEFLSDVSLPMSYQLKEGLKNKERDVYEARLKRLGQDRKSKLDKGEPQTIKAPFEK